MISLALLCGVIALFVVNPFDKDLDTRYAALAVMALGLAPAILWARNPRTNPLPLLPFLGTNFAVSYGLAGFFTPDRYFGAIAVDESSYFPALLASLGSLALIYGGYGTTLRVLGRVRVKADYSPNSQARADWFVLCIFFPAAAASRLIVQYLHLDTLAPIVAALNVIVCVWLAHGVFSRRYSGFFAAAIYVIALPFFFLTDTDITKGYLHGLIKYGLIFGLCWIVARGRMPIFAAIAVMALGIFLNQGKGEFRAETWQTDRTYTAVESLQLWASTAERNALDNADAGLWETFLDTYHRYNQLHLTAAIIENVPSKVPHYQGTTYAGIFTKWIPRFLWRDKPTEMVGNWWARPFGWIDADDYMTSFNLPWIPEMYLNFGYVGIAWISLTIGVVLGFVWRTFADAVRTPSRFATGLAICIPLMVPQESNLSISIGGAIISIATTYAFRYALSLAVPTR